MSQPFNQYQPLQYDQDGLPVTGGSTAWGAAQQPQYGQAPYGQPQYQQPAYQQPQYSQPQYGVQQQPMYGMTPGYPVAQKSMVVAALLAFFLGTLGVHNFYLGHTGRGIAQLAMTIIGWFTAIIAIGFLLIAAVGVWAFIEFIMILLRSGSMARDANGVPLS